MRNLKIKDNAAQGIAETLIPCGTIFNGDVETKGNIRIDGHVKGSVFAVGNVMIGAEGNVEGCVSGREVCISGKVSGYLNAAGPVDLLLGAKLVGDLHAVSVSIEKGAYYKGKSIISDKQSETPSSGAIKTAQTKTIAKSL